MRNSSYLLLFLAACTLTGFTCRKHKDPDELSKLPPITQTGMHAFGCLINGKAWTPKGFDRFANYSIIVDLSYAQVDISILTYRISDGIKEQFIILSDSIRQTGTYPISDTAHARAVQLKRVVDGNSICGVYITGTYYRKDYLKITRYDLVNEIISGEFEVSMVNPDCGYGDTIKITNGRFDYKF